MATTMNQTALRLVSADRPDAQRVAVLRAPGQIEVAHAEIPVPGPGEIRVAVSWVGICGSDVEAYRGARSPEFMSTPARLGHEVAGIIDAIGPGVGGLSVGQKVACRYVWGAFAQYIVCTPFNVKVLPDAFPLEEISLIEVLPGILHAAERAQIDATKTVLVMGQGVSGLVLTQVLRLYSPKALVVTDLHDRNLALARRYGATHTYRVPTETAATMDVVRGDFPDGFDIVIPCLLDGDGMADALDATAFSGRIVAYGCIGPCRTPFDFFKLHRRRVDILTTEPRRDIDMRRYLDEGVRLVLDGLINTSEMITHRLPLERIAEGFALRSDKGSDAIHVLVSCR